MSNEHTHTVGPSGTATEEPSVIPANPPGYELEEEIGRGGMGVVYRARDTALARDVAVKLLADHYPADSPSAARFLNEARITGQLQHPGIPAVHQVGTLPDGRPFLAMKLIKGNTLEAILKHRPDPAIDRGRLLATFEVVCQAVGYAHAHQVIHRDLKSANIMIGAFGEVQVMDWGLAKVLGEEAPHTEGEASKAEMTRAWTEVSPTPESGSYTQAGTMIGTPAFIAPEQAVGEIGKVDARSDVFGLGALLAIVLTGKPPYVGENYESVRVQAVRGQLGDCYGRLDGCGAEPELVALCKKCLAFEPRDRPADAGEVAKAVATLRSAAEERARMAELDRVKAEGEKAAAEAQSLERRRRRRLWIGAAAALALAVIAGLSAVLAVQAQARRDLEAKNRELADERDRAQARFDVARKAVATFHSGVIEDALLKNPQFEEMRTKLLNEAAGFYADLEKLLAGQTDAKSRKTLAAGYFELGELTDKIGSKPEALAVHRKGLAMRRELAATPAADFETRLDVARSLSNVGLLLVATGDTAGALAAYEEQQDLAAAVAAESGSAAARAVQAWGHHKRGKVLFDLGRSAEALEAYQKALALRQESADAHPAVNQYQSDLAQSHGALGHILVSMGRLAEGMAAYEKATAIRLKQVAAHPAVNEFQIGLASGYQSIGWQLMDMGRPVEGLAAMEKSLAIRQKLADAHPAVTAYQGAVAHCHDSIGYRLVEINRLEEAVEPLAKALAIHQKLADANPSVTGFQSSLASVLQNLGLLRARQGQFAEAFAALDKGLAISQKLVDADPTNTEFATGLGWAHAFRGEAGVRSGKPADAAADLRRALEAFAKVPALASDARFDRSWALALLAGLGREAKSGVTAAEAAAYADQAVTALHDAVKVGWCRPDLLKNPNFDAIRAREDFQKLVAELEALLKADADKYKDKGSK